MMRLALAEWVKFVDISQLSVALHCNSLPRFIDTLIFIYFYSFFIYRKVASSRIFNFRLFRPKVTVHKHQISPS